VDRALHDVLESAVFIKGREVALFEEEFAAFCGAKACVGVGNGTDALYLTLRALGIGPGDDVITVANTFIATAEAVSLTGASPVFVDVRPDTLGIDPEQVENAISSRTRALLPVHLYGHPCDMDRLTAIARARGLKVVEDAAQAHGAAWRGRRTGVLGDAACFSFYPGKNLGAYGDGGAVVSDDAELVRRVRMLADHGRQSKYEHCIEGVNSRLDTLQAAVLRVKLRHLESWNEARRASARAYARSLAGSGLKLPAEADGAMSAWHLYVVRTPQRDALMAHLKREGIEAGIHYPRPLHRQKPYEKMGWGDGSFPVTEAAAAEILSLPLYPEVTSHHIQRVAAAIERFGRDRLKNG
jgi:dTDP-4-amino-4,6-dideoxygalactose transaminase